MLLISSPYSGLILICCLVSTKVMKWNADQEFVPMTQPEWYSEALTQKWTTLMPGKQRSERYYTKQLLTT